MTKQEAANISTTQNQDIEPSKNNSKIFSEIILKYNILACNPQKGADFNADKAIADSKECFKALAPQGGLQEMLVAQLTSIHLLQQMTIALANNSEFIPNKQYHINSAAKLTNCFTQQAALLAKLQGSGEQKIIVEHVEVHQGGQAVVGNINGGIPPHKERK